MQDDSLRENLIQEKSETASPSPDVFKRKFEGKEASNSGE